MTNKHNINKFNSILNYLVEYKSNSLKSKYTLLKELIDTDIYTIYNNSLENSINQFENVLYEFQKVLKEFQEENKRKSFLFNSLDFFEITEIKHSKILAYLLNPYSKHGQGLLFIREFLLLLDVKTTETDKWIVTAEKGRIDVLLKRTYPNTVIVIENKSNNAIDQDNQMYRYWYQEINNNKRKQTKNDRLIYLVENKDREPSDNSLARPNYIGNNFPKVLPMEITKFTFRTQIILWLENSLKNINKDNYRLQVFLTQYIELWK